MHVQGINTSIVISLTIKGKEADLCYQQGFWIVLLCCASTHRSLSRSQTVLATALVPFVTSTSLTVGGNWGLESNTFHKSFTIKQQIEVNKKKHIKYKVQSKSKREISPCAFKEIVI